MLFGCFDRWMLWFWMIHFLDATVLDALIRSLLISGELGQQGHAGC